MPAGGVKLNAGAQLQTSPSRLFVGVKMVSEFKRLNGDLELTNFTVQKRDGQTKDKRRTFSPAGGGAKSSPTIIVCMLIDEVCIILALECFLRYNAHFRR